MKCEFILPNTDRTRKETRECGEPAVWLRITDLPGISPRRHYCQTHKDRLFAEGLGQRFVWKAI